MVLWKVNLVHDDTNSETKGPGSQEMLVEVARVELAYFISIYEGFKFLHVTMHVICSEI